MAARPQQLPEAGEQIFVLIQVLDHVERSDEIKRLCEGRFENVAPDKRALKAPPCEVQSLLEEIHADHPASRKEPLQMSKNYAGAAADLEHIADSSKIRQRTQCVCNAAVARAEPKVTVFRREERRKLLGG